MSEGRAMRAGSRISAAESILRRLLAGACGDRVPRPEVLVSVVREFLDVQFEVAADNPDGDGVLFQYGTFSHLPGPGFVVGFVRQFARPSDDGEEGGYVQLSMEYRYPPAPELSSLGRRKEWWFGGQGRNALSRWLELVDRDPVWAALSRSRPLDFTVSQEEI